MNGTLFVTPQQLINTANEFESQGQNVRTLLEEMMTKVNGLTSIWDGEASAGYIGKFRLLEDDIQRMLAMISEHVTDLNDMATEYMSAEAEAVEKTETLNTDVIL